MQAFIIAVAWQEIFTESKIYVNLIFQENPLASALVVLLRKDWSLV